VVEVVVDEADREVRRIYLDKLEVLNSQVVLWVLPFVVKYVGHSWDWEKLAWCQKDVSVC